MPRKIDIAGEIAATNEKAIATGEKIDRIKQNLEADALLLAMDRQVSKAFQAFNGILKKVSDELPPREPTPPETTCNEKNAVVSISTALKAVHLGAVAIVFKVLPKRLADFLETSVQKMIEKGVAKAVLKKAKDFTGLGTIINIGVNTAAAIDFANEQEQAIHEALGCSEGGMRADFNEVVREIKNRSLAKPSKKGKVSTRHK